MLKDLAGTQRNGKVYYGEAMCLLETTINKTSMIFLHANKTAAVMQCCLMCDQSHALMHSHYATLLNYSVSL